MENENMKYKYSTNINLIGNECVLSIKLPDEINACSKFINSVIVNEKIGKWVLDGINCVLEGKSETENRNGEVFGINISKDFTVISQIIEDKYLCKIETIELKKILDKWILELKEFNEQRHNGSLDRSLY